MTLQVDFDRLQVVEGNSDIHRSGHISHTPPEVQLKMCSIRRNIKIMKKTVSFLNLYASILQVYFEFASEG